MSATERMARILLTPAIQGQAVFLDQFQQRAVAVWAAKMAMVFDYAHAEPRRAFTSQERYVLSQTGTPPPGFVVWLAAYQGRMLTWCRSHDLVLRREDEPESVDPSDFNGHSSTFVVGHLVFRVWKLPDLKAGLSIVGKRRSSSR
jgi:hypothetical protein